MRFILFASILVAGFSLQAQVEPATVDAGKRYVEDIQSGSVDFGDALQRARDAGVSEADLLAGEILYHLKNSDLESVLRLTNRMDDVADEVSYGPESIFASKQQWLGLMHALDAVTAYRADNQASFEAEAKEAFWLWPEWTGMIGIDEIIMTYRADQIRENLLTDLTIPMDTQVRDLEGNPVTLASLAEGKKAILFDFWASWCGPCIRLMPELKAKHEKLSPQGIFVAGLNTDDESALQKASEVKESKGMDMPWLVEDEAQTMSELVMVTAIPHMILVSPKGKLLWSGHPMDDGLEEALARLGVSLE